MPPPDPSGVTIEEKPNGGWSVLYEMFMLSGRSQRKARVRRIMANLRLVLPVVRRADAIYCCEGCRKRAATARRRAPSTMPQNIRDDRRMVLNA